MVVCRRYRYGGVSVGGVRVSYSGFFSIKGDSGCHLMSFAFRSVAYASGGVTFSTGLVRGAVTGRIGVAPHRGDGKLGAANSTSKIGWRVRFVRDGARLDARADFVYGGGTHFIFLCPSLFLFVSWG